MNCKHLNEQFYGNRELVGTIGHCICKDCVFYAKNIVQNTALVEWLDMRGLDPQKADEVWCYTEKDGFKFYTVNFFEIYADQEETYHFENATISVFVNSYAKKEQLSHACSMEIMLKN